MKQFPFNLGTVAVKIEAMAWKELVSNEIQRLKQLPPQEILELLDEWTKRQDILSRQLAALRAVCSIQPETIAALLILLLEAKQSKPSSTWLRRWSKLRLAVPDPALRDLLFSLAGAYTPEANHREFHETLSSAEARERNRTAGHIARGAIWGLADFPEEKVCDFLSQTLLAWAGSGEGNPPCGNAAVVALSRMTNDVTLQCLHNLLPQVMHRSLHRKVQDALQALASQHHLSVEQLSDQLVPSHGLNAQAQRSWSMDDFWVHLRIAPEGHLELAVVDSAGNSRHSVPKRVRDAHAEVWQEILSEKRKLGKTLVSQKQRLETAMVEGRCWSFKDWSETFGNHPILAHLARRLVWTVLSGEGIKLTDVLPQVEDNVWLNASAASVPISPDSSLRLAHPVEITPEKHSAWQQYIVHRHIVQPFKQVFREIYIPTPVELENGDYSERFAGHQVSARHLYALTRTCGWGGTLGLTGFDGSGQGFRDFPTRGIRAHLCHSFASYDSEWVSLEQIWFQSLNPSTGSMPERLPLQRVDPVVFSETMRDIDLVVATASIGTDASWQAWEAARQAGELTWEQQQANYQQMAAATAKTRAAWLRELIPALHLSDRVRIDDHFARVQGDRHSYRIHLGSGNIHLEPSGRYLCIVPRMSTQQLYLPFEESDPRTAEILSKILLLVRDDQITDPDILKQIDNPR